MTQTSAWNKNIDDAPRDGTEILLRFTSQGNVSKIINWNKVHGYWQSKGEFVGLGLTSQPLVWMILPKYEGDL